jgi:hypothetical protein
MIPGYLISLHSPFPQKPLLRAHVSMDGYDRCYRRRLKLCHAEHTLLCEVVER